MLSDLYNAKILNQKKEKKNIEITPAKVATLLWLKFIYDVWATWKQTGP